MDDIVGTDIMKIIYNYKKEMEIIEFKEYLLIHKNPIKFKYEYVRLIKKYNKIFNIKEKINMNIEKLMDVFNYILDELNIDYYYVFTNLKGKRGYLIYKK